MIFTTINQDLDSAITGVTTLNNRFGILGASFKDIGNAIKSGGVRGLKDLFSSVISQADLNALKQYNIALDGVTDPAKALEKYLSNASYAAKKLAVEADGSKVELDGLKVSTNGAKSAMVGAKVATMAFNTALSMGLIFAIQAVCEGLDSLIHFQEKAYENAKEQATSARETANSAREEYEQLDELIKRYKELAQCETQDSSTREEIKSIQEEITDLVGAQAANLDLVNGKLDIQLQKLNQIKMADVNKMISTSRTSMATSRTAFDSYDEGHGHYLFDWLSEPASEALFGEKIYSFDYWGDNAGRDANIEIINDVWSRKGYGSAQTGYGMFDSFTILRLDDSLTLGEQQDAFREAIEAIEKSDDFDKNNKLYQKLVDMENELFGVESEFANYKAATNNLIDSLIISTVGNGENINSYDEYKKYFSEIYDVVRKDDDVKEALNQDIIAYDDVKMAIQDYLSGIDKYSSFASQHSMDSTVQSAFEDSLRSNSSVPDAFLIFSEEYNDSLHELFAWYDSLSEEDKKIVYTIALDTDTANWTLEEWQNSFNDAKEKAAESEPSNEPKPITYEDIITDNPDIDTDFIDSINRYRDKIKTLTTAYQSLNNENFDPTDLFIEFPQLANNADDLGNAIIELINDLTYGNTVITKSKSMYVKFQEMFGKLDCQSDIEQLQSLWNAITDLTDVSDKTNTSYSAFVSSVSETEQLSNGFNQLSKIYADINDDGSFDYSQLLNNDSFIKAFSSLGHHYDDFIETVLNNPSNIEACKAAFDRLSTSYLLNSNAIADVTDKTRNATILMLEQMGVSNAAAIVNQKLAHDKERLKYTTEEFADKEYGEIYALYKEAEAGSVTKQVLAELAIEKALINSNSINTSADIDQLIALANAANATGQSMLNLYNAKKYLDFADYYTQQYKNDKTGNKKSYRYKYEEAQAKAQEYLNKGISYNEIDRSQFSVDYSGISSSSGTSKSNQNDAFDWIEIAIQRIETAIDRLSSKASSAFNSIRTRLSSTANEIALVNKEIALQQQAYHRYMQEANSVGLSSGLSQKVQDGTIDINEYDSDTREKIKEYQEWLEKAYESADAMAELREELAKLYEDNFKSVQTDFENKIDLASHLVNQYETGLDILEARGYLESTKYYAAMQDATKNNVTILEAELASLEKYFSDAMNSGEIEKYSESWYSMQSSINGVKEELAETNVELAEYEKTMREIEWGYFDYTQERISQLTQEADFLIDLMGNSDLHTDKGQLTDEGMATMGLHGQNYNTYMAQADMYAAEILEIDKELANDPYNKELIERREELLELQQDSILTAEDEKQAIVALVEEGINLELQAMQDLIDKYAESLDTAKDLYEYQKKIKEQAANVASLQKQLSAYENDLTEETRAKVQKLTVELAKAEEELAESEYEQYISDQKKLLDELYLEYETILNQRLDNVDALISDMITAVNDNSGSINETLTTTADNVGYTMTTNMQNIWNGATNALDGTISKYGDDFSTKFTAVQSVLSSIQANTAAMVAASDGEAHKTVDNTNPETMPTTPTTSTTPPATQSTPTSTSKKTITVGGKINAKGAKIYDYAGDKSGNNQYYSNDPIYTVLAEQNGYLKVRYHKSSSGVTGWFKKSDVKAYKTGGLVDYTGLAKVDGTHGKPELMLNAEDTKNFLELRDLLRVLSSQSLTVGSSGFGSPTLSGVSDLSRMLSALRTANGGTFGTTIGDVEITIPIERVDDYNDFVTKLRNDPKFENMLLDVTIGRLAGGSSLAKNKYKW